MESPKQITSQTYEAITINSDNQGVYILEVSKSSYRGEFQ